MEYFRGAISIEILWVRDRKRKISNHNGKVVSYRVVAVVAGNSEAVTLSNLRADTQYQLVVTAVRAGKKFRSRPIVFRTLGKLCLPKLYLSPASRSHVTGAFLTKRNISLICVVIVNVRHDASVVIYYYCVVIYYLFNFLTKNTQRAIFRNILRSMIHFRKCVCFLSVPFLSSIEFIFIIVYVYGKIYLNKDMYCIE